MKPIKRSQLISVFIPQGTGVGAQVTFPDIPELRDAVIDGLEAYTADQLSVTPNGQGVIPASDIVACVVNLVQESDRRGQDFPAFGLVSSSYGGIWKEFDNWRLNWQKCYIQIVDSAPFEVSAAALAFNVFYHY